MNDFIKMDIFFFIASVELVVLGVLVGFILWKLLRILNHVEHIAEVAGKEAAHLQEDAAYLRGRLVGALDGIFSFIPRRRTRESKESTD